MSISIHIYTYIPFILPAKNGRPTNVMGNGILFVLIKLCIFLSPPLSVDTKCLLGQ